MATPRKRWFRVADSLTQEAFTNDELAAVIRLMGELNQRWARDGLSSEEASSITLRPGDLMSCTGAGTLKRGRSILCALSVRISLTVTPIGANTVINWPKWPDFQGITSLNQGNPRAKKSPSATAPAPAPAPASKKNPVPTPNGVVVADKKEARDKAWAEINGAFKQYMPRARGLTLTDSRRGRLRSIIKAHGKTGPVDAIHGYAAMHFTRPGNGDFDPLRNFNPETIWRPANVGKYLDADKAAVDAGFKRPYGAIGDDGGDGGGGARDRFNRVMELLTKKGL